VVDFGLNDFKETNKTSKNGKIIRKILGKFLQGKQQKLFATVDLAHVPSSTKLKTRQNLNLNNGKIARAMKLHLIDHSNLILLEIAPE
jgi:hypothetical protein